MKIVIIIGVVFGVVSLCILLINMWRLNRRSMKHVFTKDELQSLSDLLRVAIINGNIKINQE